MIGGCGCFRSSNAMPIIEQRGSYSPLNRHGSRRGQKRANKRQSLCHSIGRSSNISPLAGLGADACYPWNFMANGELRLQQISQAGRNPRRFDLAPAARVLRFGLGS